MTGAPVATLCLWSALEKVAAAGERLREIVGKGEMDEEAANRVIMAARAHWFKEEQA